MSFRDFKDLRRITSSDKVLRDKPFNIAKNSGFDGCQRGLAPKVYTFFKKTLKVLILHQLIQLAMLLKLKLCQISHYQKIYTNQSLKNLEA